MGKLRQWPALSWWCVGIVSWLGAAQLGHPPLAEASLYLFAAPQVIPYRLLLVLSDPLFPYNAELALALGLACCVLVDLRRARLASAPISGASAAQNPSITNCVSAK